MINYGIGQTEAPLSQQNFGAPREIKAPQFNGGQTFVPGVGMLGPDLGGAVKGDMARQEYMLKESENQREEEKLGLAKEKFGLEKDYLAIAQEDLGIRLSDLNMRKEEHSWKVEDRDKLERLDSGMKEAASREGYFGVIDYLKRENPVMALEFHAKKLKLDEGIMQNNVMQARLPAEKATALAESYRVLGKLAMGVLQAPEKDRQEMYSHMLPMTREVWPDAPDNLEEAVPSLMLATAQAAPESQLFAAKYSVGSGQDKISKMYDSLRRAQIQGNSDEAQSIKLEIEKNEDQARMAQMRLSQLDTKNAKDTSDAKIKANDGLVKISKAFVERADSFRAVHNLLDVLGKNPRNGMAMSALRTQFSRANGEKGPQSDGDILRLSGAAGVENLEKKALSWLTGENVQLNEKEIGQVRAVLKEQINQEIMTQKKREDQYKTMLKSDPNTKQLFDPESLSSPSKLLYDSISVPPPSIEEIQEASSDPQARQEFIEAFGFDPASFAGGQK